MSDLAPWAGRLLEVNLSTGAVATRDSAPLAASYLGGRGFAARLAWDLVAPGMAPFDERAPLFFMPGALVGTPAPSAGRVTVCGLSPHAHPHEWYTRANLGGHWGPECKYAGYDGLIVTGRASEPVLLAIDDGRVEVRGAGDLWGLGLVETQLRLRESLGPDWRALAIGPAGEHGCRFAIIATGTESAAGQGGFGAVMGSKRLKAIAVRGHGGVAVAHPEALLPLSRQVGRMSRRIYGDERRATMPLPAGQRRSPCTAQCPRACGAFYEGELGLLNPERRHSGQVFCCAPFFQDSQWMPWRLPSAAGTELAQTCNELGLNHWELVFGLAPWMAACQRRGELLTLGGERVDLNAPGFWLVMLERIAYRRGWGDALAEGGPRAAAILGVGEDLIGRFYPAWGHASHWDGHGSFPMPHYPYWLETALQWALDSRDPMGGGHGYTTNIYRLVGKLRLAAGGVDHERLRRAGQALYGSAEAVDPWSGYDGKAAAARFHHDRAALKDCLGICDNIFPLLTDAEAPDLLARVDDVAGPQIEHALFAAASDLELSAEQLDQVGARTFTLERLLAIRNWGRTRATDETILAYLRQTEGRESPFVGHTVAVDPQRFAAMLSEYYALRGWDSATGHPSAESLAALGLEAMGSHRRPQADGGTHSAGAEADGDLGISVGSRG